MKRHVYFASSVSDGGIYHYLLEEEQLKFVEKTTCDRPMYLEVDGSLIRVLLKEGRSGSQESRLVTYQLEKDGRIGKALESMSTRGREACHLCSFHGLRYAANYSSGSIFSSNGSLLELTGKGVDPERQEAPHPHYVFPAPDDSCLLAVDLGLDAIYSCDEALNILHTAYLAGGSGPRHLAYSEDGRFVFCANELESSVSVFCYENQQLTLLETVSTLEEEKRRQSTENYPAAIRVQGNFVYVSNRGDDSIACFSWDGSHLKLCTLTLK